LKNLSSSFYIVFIAILSCFAPSLLFAKAKSVVIEGNSYNFDQKTGIYYYQKPRIVIGDDLFTATLLKYDTKKQIAHLTGNVTLRNKQLLLTGTKLTYNVKTKEALFENATLFSQEKNVYITAKKIRRVSENKFIIHEGILTNCNPQSPGIEIHTSYLVYNIDDFAWATNTRILFHGFPVAYTPIISWSTKANRATGLLAPKFTFNFDPFPHLFEKRLQLPYFIAFDKEHDLTVTPDFIQTKGTGLGLEYNYAFTKGMKGELIAWYLDETDQERDLNNENIGALTSNPTDLTPARYFYSLRHKQNFFGGQLFLTSQRNSDEQVKTEYFSSSVDLEYASQDKLQIAFPWNGGGLQIKVDQGKQYLYASIFDKSTDESTHLSRLPEIELSQAFSRIFGSPISFSTDLTNTQFSREEGWKGSRTQAVFDINIPISFRFLNIIPSYRKTFNSYDIKYLSASGDTTDSNFTEYDQSFGWNHEYISLEMNFELFRFYKKAGKNIGKLSIRPRLIYEFVSDTDQRNSLATSPGSSTLANTSADYTTYSTMFDSQDQTFAKQTLTFQIDTKYFGKIGKATSVSELFSLSLIQIFDLNRKDSSTDTESAFQGPQIAETYRENDYGEKYLPLRISMALTPSPAYKASLFYRYDHNTQKILETSFSLAVKSNDGGSLSVGYTRNTKAYQEFDGSPEKSVSNTYSIANAFHIGSQLSMSLSGTWDMSRKTLEESTDSVVRLNRFLTGATATLTYNNPCYTLTANYTESITTGTFDQIEKEYVKRQVTLTFTVFGQNFQRKLLND
jgi:lipopolysaccharide assembly outer membrane protein LptD (OstA)